MAKATKEDLKEWVIEALQSLGGSGSVFEVSKLVWLRHEHDLRTNEQLFYKWQYDLRWAAFQLRKEGRLKAANDRAVKWELP